MVVVPKGHQKTAEAEWTNIKIVRIFMLTLWGVTRIWISIVRIQKSPRWWRTDARNGRSTTRHGEPQLMMHTLPQVGLPKALRCFLLDSCTSYQNCYYTHTKKIIFSVKIQTMIFCVKLIWILTQIAKLWFFCRKYLEFWRQNSNWNFCL